MKILLIGADGKMGKEMQSFLQGTAEEFFGIDKYSNRDFCFLPDVIIDFSCADALISNLELADKFGIPIVIATTGHTPNGLRLIKQHSKTLPVFMASNFSILFSLMKKLCENIKGNFECVVTEKHHINKKDKPSGSAKWLIQTLKNNNLNPSVVCHRVSNVIGEHQVEVFLNSEVLLLKHTAYSRQVFCQGAYMACKYIAQKKNGLYGMEDMICDCL